MNPNTLRRLVLTTLVVPGACAVNDAGWETKPDAWPLPAVFVDSTAAEIQAACPKVFKPSGCAVRNYRLGVCYVYVEPNVPRWLATHELTHCAGFSHP